MANGPYLRLAEVAGVLSTTPRQVRRLVAAGKLGAVRTGVRQLRVPPDELERFLERERVVGAASEVK
jgi:excisionase family DNA binding protein